MDGVHEQQITKLDLLKMTDEPANSLML